MESCDCCFAVETFGCESENICMSAECNFSFLDVNQYCKENNWMKGHGASKLQTGLDK